MSTNPVTSSISSLPDPSSSAVPSATNSLGKDAFLRLLTTQLQNQDPLQPVDNQAFVAQLAQFSQLEQLQSLGDKLDTLLLAQASANQVNTAALVGKDVQFRSGQVNLAAGKTAAFDVTLDGASQDTVALLSDASGRVVRTLPLGPRDAGTFDVAWDGLDDRGNALPSGSYSLTVSATGSDGSKVTSATRVRGTVTGVTFENQAPELIVGGPIVKLSDVVEIDSPPASGG